MEFYPEVGVTRDVSSKPDTKLYALRSLLSVRWLVIEERNEEQSPMPGYSYVRTDGNFNLYENDHFVPMGFAFDHYITRETFDATAKDYRCRLLMKGLLLEDDAIARHSDILTKLSDQQADTLSEDAFVADWRRPSAGGILRIYHRQSGLYVQDRAVKGKPGVFQRSL